jgi:hypothetical protein
MAVSKTLKGIYAFLTLCILAAGLISIIFANVWRAPDTLRNLVISGSDLTAGLVLGIFLAVTFFVAVVAGLQGTHITMGLVVLNWFLIVDACVVIAIGTYVWFSTLRERANFSSVWDTHPDKRQALQDMFQCCGYFNGTDRVVNAGFCADAAATANNTGCVGPITKSADYTLNNIFTSSYGFMVIIILLFLASLCTINKREEAERFRKIDAKRGGRGFV